MGAQTPQIQSTRAYAQFKTLRGNRVVDYNHVKRLKREMEANPELMASNPILVNENMEIIDGQHRRQAAQELNIPIYYIVAPGLTIEATQHLNTSQRRWTLLDFARSFADSMVQDYRVFLEMHDKYPGIAPSILRVYLVNGQKHDIDVDFRRGEFRIADLELAQKNLDRLVAIMAKTGIKINASMSNALWQLWTDSENFNHEQFMEKLDRETAQQLLVVHGSVHGCLRSIEDVYNFNSKVRVRLY